MYLQNVDDHDSLQLPFFNICNSITFFYAFLRYAVVDCRDFIFKTSCLFLQDFGDDGSPQTLFTYCVLVFNLFICKMSWLLGKVSVVVSRFLPHGYVFLAYSFFFTILKG